MVQKREDVRELDHLIPPSPLQRWLLVRPLNCSPSESYSPWLFNLALHLSSPRLASCLITLFSVAMLLIRSHSATGQRMCWKKAHLFWSEHCRWYSAPQDKA